MPWFKVDDHFHSHRKIAGAGLSMAARGLWVTAGSWSADQLTDGFVPQPMLRQWGATRRQARELVDARLWQEVDGGYQFHQWAEHQPPAEQIRRRRDAERTRKRRTRSSSRPSGVPPGQHAPAVRARDPQPDPDPDPDPTTTTTSPSRSVAAAADDPHVLGTVAARLFDETWAQKRGQRLGLHSGHSSRGARVAQYFQQEAGPGGDWHELLRAAARNAAAELGDVRSPWAVFASQPGKFLHRDQGNSEERTQRQRERYRRLSDARDDAYRRGDHDAAEQLDAQLMELLNGASERATG